MRIRKAIDMRIQSKQELKEIVAYERALWIKRMYPNGCQHNIRNHTLTYMKALRIVEYYSSQSKFQRVWGGYYYWKLIYKVLGLITNVSIPPYVFDKGLLIMHLQNIVISAKVKVGENACLFHNTTLGIKLGHNADGKCPKIGNGVTICTGSCILGDVYLASGITVAANAVVNKSFEEENVVVGGIPAKIISKDPEWSMLQFVEQLNK